MSEVASVRLPSMSESQETDILNFRTKIRVLNTRIPVFCAKVNSQLARDKSLV